MTLNRISVCLLILLPSLAGAQYQTLNPERYAHFYANSHLQTPQQLKDTTGTFKQGSVFFGFVLPALHKEWNSEMHPIIDIQLHAALNYTRIQNSSMERMLHNPQLTATSFFGFTSANRITLSLRTQLNEDEFTATFPVPKINGMVYYSRTLHQQCRFHLGAGYSFIFGKANWYPIVGTDLLLSEKSRFILLYPLLGNYQYTPVESVRFSLFAKPNGIMSYWENRLNIPDTNQKTIVFGLKGMNVGADVSWLIIPSLTVNVFVAYGSNQSLRMDNSTASTTYLSQSLSDAFAFGTGITWRPWQSGKRNKKVSTYNFKNDVNFIIPF